MNATEIFEKYEELFGVIDTFSLVGVLEPEALLKRMEKAIEEKTPIDIEKEFGLEPAPEGADL